MNKNLKPGQDDDEDWGAFPTIKVDPDGGDKPGI